MERQKLNCGFIKKYRILKGAKAIIRTFGVLGDKYVEIKQGKIKVALKPGEIIKYTESSIEIDQVLADLAPTLKTLKEFVGSSQTQEDFKDKGDQDLDRYVLDLALKKRSNISDYIKFYRGFISG